MAQLKVKQILDFVTAVAAQPVGTATSTAIATAKTEAIAAAESKDVLRAATAVSNISTAKSEAIASGVASISTAKSEAIASAESKDVERAATAVTNIATAKSEAIASAVSADTVLSTAVSSAIATVDGRVTTLLNGSTAALDTFGEIKGFIDSLASADVTVFAAISTAVSNDAVHASAISANSSAIASVNTSAQTFANTAESNAIASAESKDVLRAATAVSNISTAKSEAIASGVASIATAKSEAIASGVASIATAKSEAIASALSSATLLTNALDTRIDTLEGQDITQQMGIFETPESFTIANSVISTDLGLKVFINGLQIHANASGDGYTTLDGRLFTLVTLGYVIDADDHIVVYGVKG